MTRFITAAALHVLEALPDPVMKTDAILAQKSFICVYFKAEQSFNCVTKTRVASQTAT